ncbi:hypothetical protein QQZ08_010198 [Neonectria magnoliae]|uniref:Uncharacterized protein n=1 Tax=Neonectria magnoliae TaxID=2732573 RepID=A0ABR1HIP1_9HYPO
MSLSPIHSASNPTAPKGIAPALVNAGVLLELALGLRVGVLGDVVVDEGLYRAFVTCFALQREEEVPRDDAIRMAHRFSMLMVGDARSMPPSPPPSPPPLQDEKLYSAICLLQTLCQMRGSQINGMTTWIKVTRRRFSGRDENQSPSNKADDLETILDRHASVRDWNMSKSNLLDIAHYIWANLEAPISHLLTTLDAERIEVEAVVDALVTVSIQDEKDDMSMADDP